MKYVSHFCCSIGRFENEGSSTSPYEASASWENLCTQNNGRLCCSDNSCDACSSASRQDCEGCCEKCPKQICARIFCLIVPFLYNTFNFLKQRLVDKDWQEMSIVNLDNGKDPSSLCSLMSALGFDTRKDDGDLKSDMRGTDVEVLLNDIVPNLNDIQNGILTALAENTIGDHSFIYPNGFQQHLQEPGDKPRTISDMLQWLYLLPYSCNYNALLQHLTETYGVNRIEAKTSLNKLIVELPIVFTTLEGTGEILTGNSLFRTFGPLSKCKQIFNPHTYTDLDKCSRTLLGIIVILNSVLNYFMDQSKQKVHELHSRSDSVELRVTYGELKLNGSSVNRKRRDYKTRALNTFCKFMGFEVDSAGNSNGNFRGSSLHEWFGNLKCSLDALNFAAEQCLAKRSEHFTENVDHTTDIILDEPESILEMMLWLIGVHFTCEYKELVDKDESGNAIEEQLQKALGPNCKSTAITEKLIDTCQGLVVTIIALEGGAHSILQFFTRAQTDRDAGFSYDSAYIYAMQCKKETMLSQFRCYVYLVHLQLRFLYVMCKRDTEVGGWHSCRYDSTEPIENFKETEEITCSCDDITNTKCDHDLLKKFLYGEHTVTAHSFKRLFNSEGIEMNFPMGFNKTHLGCGNIYMGRNIFLILQPIFDEIATGTNLKHIKPFSTLANYLSQLGHPNSSSWDVCLTCFKSWIRIGMVGLGIRL